MAYTKIRKLKKKLEKNPENGKKKKHGPAEGSVSWRSLHRRPARSSFRVSHPLNYGWCARCGDDHSRRFGARVRPNRAGGGERFGELELHIQEKGKSQRKGRAGQQRRAEQQAGLVINRAQHRFEHGAKNRVAARLEGDWLIRWSKTLQEAASATALPPDITVFLNSIDVLKGAAGREIITVGISSRITLHPTGKLSHATPSPSASSWCTSLPTSCIHQIKARLRRALAAEVAAVVEVARTRARPRWPAALAGVAAGARIAIGRKNGVCKGVASALHGVGGLIPSHSAAKAWR